MIIIRKIDPRRRLMLAGLVLGLGVGLIAIPSGPVVADDDPVDPPGIVVRVEEDWELVVKEPNVAVASPQVSTQMKRKPTASRFCNFHLNSCDVPTFSQGGLQLQVWKGSQNIDAITSTVHDVMATANEKVTWTQYLKRDEGLLKFGISKAASTTWGDFSGVEMTVQGGQLNLDFYDVSYSAKNSGVSYGANRVQSFKLLRVRKYLNNVPEPIEDATGWQVFPGVVSDPAVGGMN